MPEQQHETQTQIPGFIAKIEVHGSQYTEMIASARSAFDSLFRDVPWAFMGAQIVPHEQENAFDGTVHVILWRAEFYAMTLATEAESNGP